MSSKDKATACLALAFISAMYVIPAAYVYIRDVF